MVWQAWQAAQRIDAGDGGAVSEAELGAAKGYGIGVYRATDSSAISALVGCRGQS